jgi:lon-related putative ATP-dependent protease
MNIEEFRVSREMARWRCDPALLGFKSTEELEPIDSFIGQDRAVKALEFGLGLNSPGYNIFVTGLTGTGKSTVIRSHLAAAVSNGSGGKGEPNVFDWCYVYNFDQPDQPQAIRLQQGEGAGFAQAIEDLQGSLRRALPEAFDDDAYKNELKSINQSSFAKRNQHVLEADRMAREQGFSVQLSPAGIAVIPMQGEEPMDQATFASLPESEQDAINKSRRAILNSLDQAMEELRSLEDDRITQVGDLDRNVVENVVAVPFQKLTDTFSDSSQVLEFIEKLRTHTLQNISAFRAPGPEIAAVPMPAQFNLATFQRDPLLPYKINLFVDNSNTDRKQIVTEENPTYAHLFGQIERPSTLEARPTDHTMLKAGSLVRASGGFLVLEARDVLAQSAVWPALKRVLRDQETQPEDPAAIFAPGFFSQGLRPEPIPIDVKVVMSGEPEIYSALARFDPDFWQVFKIRADLDFQTDINADRLMEYSRFISGLCTERATLHFSSDGAAEIIERAARMVDSQQKLSTRFGLLADIVVEAADYAAISGAKIVGRKHVIDALEGRTNRSARIADAVQEMMLDGTLIVDLDGARIGQVNGLSVYGDGDVVFGRPSKITARSFMGAQGVVNVEREVDLAGQTHDKGVLIISGYLGATFAKHIPLSVNVSIVFEQSYGLIDGDSASSTELYAILSSLAEVPIRQDIAVTGSINQFGEIQPIGGVNEKIEGFFDLCSASGKLGSAGVIIPRKNLLHLMLRDDVLDAMESGEFTLYAVDHVDHGIEILTGVEAGIRGDDGMFPADSINGLVNSRLREYALGLRNFGSTSEKLEIVEILPADDEPGSE